MLLMLLIAHVKMYLHVLLHRLMVHESTSAQGALQTDAAGCACGGTRRTAQLLSMYAAVVGTKIAPSCESATAYVTFVRPLTCEISE